VEVLVAMGATILPPPALLLPLHPHTLSNNMADTLPLHPHRITPNHKHHTLPLPVMAHHLHPVARQVLRMVDMGNSNRLHRQQLPHQHQEHHIVAVTDLLSPRVMTKTVATALVEAMVHLQQVEAMGVNRTVAMVVLPAVVATMQDLPDQVHIHSLEALHHPMEVGPPHKGVQVVTEDLHQEDHMGLLRDPQVEEEDMGLHHHQMEIMGDKVVDITKVVVAVAAMVVEMTMAAAVVAAAVEMVAGMAEMMKIRWYRRTQSLSPICLTM